MFALIEHVIRKEGVKTNRHKSSHTELQESHVKDTLHVHAQRERVLDRERKSKDDRRPFS